MYGLLLLALALAGQETSEPDEFQAQSLVGLTTGIEEKGNASHSTKIRSYIYVFIKIPTNNFNR